MDKITLACVAEVGEVNFQKSYDEGRKMSLGEAIAYALSEN